MFYKKINRNIVFFIFLVVAVVGVWFLLNFIKIGPGLPPSESMPKWYIPGSWQKHEQSCTSLFPEISSYCDKRNFSGGKFISVWYFDDESKFLNGEEMLYLHLEENGNVFHQELNISTELHEEIERREVENFPNITSFNSTRYESPNTSGYFIVYERPFLKGREDYFIAYYGIMGTTNLSEETPALKKLIAESFYMSNEEGKVDGLKMGNKKGTGNSLLPWF
ncbi:hypothetical protein MSSIT_0483 [Methanosarcina siciliae T4/M]|uniref:Methanolan biosynthesis EpsI domain-containing protein n=2 Tax=Methanosarcina siciliae TaxID=38027 RepID=A0A0E3PAK8_9EURY|nr:hypothetical protein [Methanosarcina siciliae]AKB27202.1 hypothetical protein MSSIT_0483 [Methanosarcina siciliae T4/M]AKB31149.1 hypothetical protein MSSIH_0459 [Methanosarcina siciliae HI350]